MFFSTRDWFYYHIIYYYFLAQLGFHSFPFKHVKQNESILFQLKIKNSLLTYCRYLTKRGKPILGLIVFLLKFPTYNALLKLSQHVTHTELNTITLPAFELVASCCVCHLFCFCNFITYTRSSHDNSITIPDWQLLEYDIKLAF